MPHTATASRFQPRRSTSLWAALRGMQAVYRQRRALARLSDSALCDLGLTRAEALHEAARPVWDLPTNWRA